jgi:hypothetical protein
MAITGKQAKLPAGLLGLRRRMVSQETQLLKRHFHALQMMFVQCSLYAKKKNTVLAQCYALVP